MLDFEQLYLDYYAMLPALTLTAGSHAWALYPVIFFLYTAFLCYGILAIGRVLIRNNPDEPWYLRARQTYPLRVLIDYTTGVASAVALFISLVLYVGSWPVPQWLFSSFCAAASYMGSIMILPALYRWACIPIRCNTTLRRYTVCNLITQVTFYSCFIVEFELTRNMQYRGLITAVLLILTIILVTCSGITIGIMWLCGLICPPSERLARIAAESYNSSGLQRMPHVFELRSNQANALAFPTVHRVAVTTQALELLSDDELKTVLLHEYAHLSESHMQFVMRLAPLTIYLLFLGCLTLIVHSRNAFYWYPPTIIAILVIYRFVSARITHSLEERADDHATKAAEEYEADYARALEKLYRKNLVPSVLHKGLRSHPNLYDRMLKAGVTPNFIRPLPPARRLMVIGGIISTVMTVGFAVTLFLMNYKAQSVIKQEQYDDEGFYGGPSDESEP